MMKNQRVREWETLVWKRPKEVYGEQGIPFTIYESVKPNDIKQGKCGDCYFLSSLSALAEYPERIEKIFLTKEVNEAGCYAVSLFVNGEKRTVVVDDYFPYDTHKQNWAFSRPSEEEDEKQGRKTKELWVLILEKAWAKVFGSYQRIEAGTAGEAFYPLTGCPHKFFIHSDCRNLDRLWQTILRSDNLKFPMCTAVASQANEALNRTDMKKVGLVDAHAYTLIGATILKLDDGSEERLCKIRNPWGKKEWTGDWSDSSPLWTENTK